MKTAAIVTATRAEYGLLKPLIGALSDEPGHAVRLIVTGTHLAPEYGHTVDAIEADGWTIDARVDMLVSGSGPAAAVKSLGLLAIGLADTLGRLAPDCVVILGDRYEMVGVAMAANLFAIPVVHIHGGEITVGANDDAFRHAITKLSHLHFTATEEYRQRVIQLGERPESVHAVGAIGLDAIKRLQPLSRDGLLRPLGLDPAKPFFLVTYHPVTAQAADAVGEIDALMTALLEFSSHHALVTFANADVGGREINDRIVWWANRYPERLAVTASLGQHRYLSALAHCDGVVGNSSSGIIEAPSFAVGTLDIGPRQMGRTRADSVVGAEATVDSIRAGLSRITSADFRSGLPSICNPYGDGHTVERIMSILTTWNPQDWRIKRFFDIAR
jgi:UDP-hydrolysing UDP-N-acetyl-D-glucosamine 2-epimerase